MKRIGLLSDTHGFLDPKIKSYFSEVDEIWHAGDIGSIEVLDELKAFKPTKAVWGNIDNKEIRQATDEFLRFQIEDVSILMTHIGGKPEKYSKPTFEEIEKNGAPTLFVCGHSHITLVKMDPNYKMLWMNPGACGYKGFHKVKTILRFNITNDRIHDLELIELGKRA
ncbi:MAG: metallophosphoesterase family protein [Crocinitomicaceae bacterium]|nr:metallophosphoesterase family protein [Crocinitomicaceae bacterium]